MSRLIKSLAYEQGFTACGITRAELLREESLYFREWLANGYQAGMGYMNRNVDKRLDPSLLNEWAHSIIVLLFNYFPADQKLSKGSYRISKYAYGRDYHDVIKKKLELIVEGIEDEVGGILARVFTDSAPVMERAWAKRCGLGWTGKNACLIDREKGSYLFIGTIITNLDLAYDEASSKDLCGKCTRCIDACPNGAIVAPGVIDAGKCISYLTIEHKGDFKETDDLALHSWIFGCDICQDVCPWNRIAKPHTEPSFLPMNELLNMQDEDWEKLDAGTFDKLFKQTAVERTGYDGLRRNIDQVNKESRIRNKE